MPGRPDFLLHPGPGGGRSRKSTTAAELACAAAGAKNGSGWLEGLSSTCPSSTSTKKPAKREIRRQFYRHGGAGNPNLFVASCQGFRLDDPKTLQKIKFEVKTRGIGLRILDTVSHFFANADDNSSKDVGGLFLPLLELRDQYNLTIVLLHHLRKPPQNASVDDLMDRVRGTTAYTTQPSAAWGQVPTSGGHTADLQVLKRRGGGSNPTIRIEYQETDGHVTLRSAGNPDQMESELDRAIHSMSDVLRKSTQEVWTTSDILYLGTDYPKRTAERALKTLTDTGVIRRISKGKYVCDTKVQESEQEMFDTDAPDDRHAIDDLGPARGHNLGRLLPVKDVQVIHVALAHAGLKGRVA